MSLQNNQLLGAQDIFQAELPPSFTGQGVAAEPSQQDIFVVGQLYADLPGVTPSLGAIRYGRGGNRGEMRIVAGPTDLGIMIPMGQAIANYALRPSFMKLTAAPIIGVVSGNDAKIYFYNARNLTQFVPSGGTVNYIDLSNESLAVKPQKLATIYSSGTKFYVGDATQSIIVQYDMMSATSTLCHTDSQVVAISDGGSGQIAVLTKKGTAKFMGDCSSGTLASVSPPPAVPAPGDLDLPARSFFVTERIIEPTMSAAPNNTKGRRGTFVTLLGTANTTVTISPGTCTNRTSFLIGDITGTPTTGTTVNLSVAVPTKALYAEQTYPGEDCYVFLTSGTGEAILRVRGGVEGLGATTVLLDRSWSMERSFRGVGDPANATEQRIAILRNSVISLLGTVTLPLYVPPPPQGLPNPAPITGQWAYMPFTDDAPSAWSTPASGFTSGYTMKNPDNPNGMRIKGYGTAGSDKLDPGGPSNLAQAMRAALTRLATADSLPPDTTGAARRLWIVTDSQSGRTGYTDNQQLLAAMLKGTAQLRYFGIGGFGLDPLLQQFVALSYGLAGERQYGPPRGHAIEAHTPSALHEGMIAATVRDALRGRPLGTIARGEMNKAVNKSLSITLKTNRDAATMRDDPWVMIVAAWDHADATPNLSFSVGSTPYVGRCERGPTSMVCVAAGTSGTWTATLTTDRPGNASTFGMLRAFTAATGPTGEVSLHSSFARNMYKSGQRVRVQAYLTERGLPLRLATVTAKVYGPNLSLGTLASQAKVAQNDVASLVTGNGDITPGEAKVELLDPADLPAQKPVALNLQLYDDGVNGSDNESQDGIYQGEFQAFIPGVYTVDIHAEYTGVFPNNNGTVEDRLTTNVVTALDQNLTSQSVRSEPLNNGLRLRFSPQDAGKNLLGPGQAGALYIGQGTKIANVKFDDFLDGSYRAEVTGIDTTKPFDLLAPGSRIQIYDPARPPTMDDSGGCAVSARNHAPASLFSTLMLAIAALLLRRRRASSTR